MKVIEVLKFNREQIKRMLDYGIRPDDVRFIDLFTDYKAMTAHGDKVSYAVAVLSEKYAVSERKVYDLIKRFKSDCKPLAV